MKRALILVLVAASFSRCSSQLLCNIEGSWVIRKGRINKNYEMAAPYTSNLVSFSRDTIELASGFFYQTDDMTDTTPIGRYPFVYYGNLERFRITGDSLQIFSHPYDDFRSFKINCRSKNELMLVGTTETVLLIKSKNYHKVERCKLKSIKAHIYGADDDIDLFKINYSVTFSADDKLVYEDLALQRDYKKLHFNLNKGTFGKICAGFRAIDIAKLKPIYESGLSEVTIIELEITSENGQISRTILQNEDYPDELRLALIPVLFLHQSLVHPELTPVR